MIVFPDYENNILGVTSSLLRHYGILTTHPGLERVDRLLALPCKNIVLIILDGLGSACLRRLSPPESFLRRHYLTDLSSVYPCTTTAATTSLLTGLSPLEHGWIGWNAWFKEYGRIVDLFLDRDSFAGMTIEPSPAQSLLPFEDITAKIGRSLNRPDADKVQCRRVLPPFAENGVSHFADFVDKIGAYCQEPGHQLILGYWYEPDTLMHREGPYSPEVRQEIETMDQLLDRLDGSLDDTLMIITADHGQVEITREIFLDDIPELMDCLILPPSLEVRAASLFVKPGAITRFEALFQERLSDSFLLMPRREVLERGLFGSGTPHRKVDDFLGDYLACGTGQAILRYRSLFNRPRTPFKGHHAGLCEEEMLVPLIAVEPHLKSRL